VPSKKLGVTIKRFRERRGLTQEALAKKAGLHRVYVAQIEGQTKVPSLAALEKLAKALRVKVGRLLE
jgi:transcriptional regulator with XRE-family HTH domain